MNVTIYHNPRCGKSRETLALLRQRGVEPVVVEYLQDPPDASRVMELAAMLGGDAQALVRRKEPAYAGSGLTESSSTREIAEAIEKFPILLERPIVVFGQKAAIGRPPENVLNILEPGASP